jgi:magnesium transporter
MPVTAHYFTSSGEIRALTTVAEIKNAFDSQQGLLWVDINQITAADSDILLNTFNFHHLSVEDCMSDSPHTSKIDDFTSHLFIIINDIQTNEEGAVVDPVQLALFLGLHFVVTTHHAPLHCIDHVSTLLIKKRKPFKHESAFLAHAIIDTLIDDILPVINSIDSKTSDLEDDVVVKINPALIQEILQMKHSAALLHRILIPQREILSKLSRGEFSIIKKDALIFYRDIYDHIVQIEEMLLTMRDSFDNAMNLYMSSIANKQNETMRILSIVATYSCL